jgi:SnoaL-like protein
MMDTAAGPSDVTVRDSRADEDLVRRFLADVRSGSRVDLAGRYLAPRVIAHQGRPGAVRSVVVRTPGEYVDHVLEMLSASGPWTFDVVLVRRTGELVDATWRQTGTVNVEGPSHGRPIVEHGQATYRVVAGRITEYWIQARREILLATAHRPGPTRIEDR